jgi:hypothetical protein
MSILILHFKIILSLDFGRKLIENKYV